MITLRAIASGSGRVVGWLPFICGELVDANRWTRPFLTTVLTDVVSDLIDECFVSDPSCEVVVLSPNGFTKSAFDICLQGKGFKVTCGRRLVRGFFPLNPLAAEFGRNYDVLVTVEAENPDVEQRLADVVTSAYRFEQLPANSRQRTTGDVH